MEPDINSSPAKFQRLVEDELARLAPLIKVNWTEARLSGADVGA
jgi:hypothetical protein